MFVFWGLVVCLLAGVRFLSFSGLKGPNSGPPRVVVCVDESRVHFGSGEGSAERLRGFVAGSAF